MSVTIGYLDIIIAVVLILGCVRGGMLGLIRQTTDVVGLVLTAILAIALTSPVGLMIEDATGWPRPAALAVSFVAIFAAVKLCSMLVARSAEGAADALKLSGVNRAGGTVIGAFKAALLMSGVFLIIAYAELPDNISQEESVLYGPVSGILPETWRYVSGKAPMLEEYRQRIEDEAREGVEELGGLGQ